MSNIAGAGADGTRINSPSSTLQNQNARYRENPHRTKHVKSPQITMQNVTNYHFQLPEQIVI
jgi:hypothetical protein